jgi:hypothetical protein
MLFRPHHLIARAAQAFAVAAGLLMLSAPSASAQTDWSSIRDALHAEGIVQPGNVLCFDLVRKDLNVLVSGKPVSPGEVANGYVHFLPRGNNTFFVNGSLPAQDWQASNVAAALHTARTISVSAIVNHGAKSNPNMIWVHFEATDTANNLLPAIVKALGILKDPQIGVTSTHITVPPSFVPAKFKSLFAKGSVTQINDIFAFSLPRPDQQLYFLGKVHANPFLGVAQTVFVQTLTGDASQLILNAEFALRSDEVQPVIFALQRGGFTVPALHDHFIDDHARLYFVHGFAMGTNQATTTAYLNALFNAFQVIHAHQQ